MAITGITISQSNITDSVNLLSVHNPLVFIANAAYTGSAPDLLNVSVLDSDDAVLGTFSAIPYKDLVGARQFVFIANSATSSILKSYMGEIEDFTSNEKVLEYVEGITKEFTIKFYDPAAVEVLASVSFVAMHAVQQFGNAPYLESIYINEARTYYAAAGKPVYVYFYNNDSNNVISVGSGTISFDLLLDYDDIALLDFDSQYLQSL